MRCFCVWSPVGLGLFRTVVLEAMGGCVFSLPERSWRCAVAVPACRPCRQMRKPLVRPWKKGNKKNSMKM